MNMNDRYHINKPDVILESFDDEVVIVNLGSGNYYSIDALGAEIWGMLQKGSTANEITAQLSREYDSAVENIEAGVAEFIGILRSEALIVTDPAASSTEAAMDGAVVETRRPFAPPVLHKYTDMQELLLVDPIHDVDETGWPNIPNNAGPDSNSKES